MLTFHDMLQVILPKLCCAADALRKGKRASRRQCC